MIGRPSTYDPAYCDQIVEFCQDGSSISSFAASIRVARSTINVWMADNADFSEAVKTAKAAVASWYDKAARKIVIDGGGNATLCIFGLKNFDPDDFRDKTETEHSGTLRHERIERIIVDPTNPDR